MLLRQRRVMWRFSNLQGDVREGDTLYWQTLTDRVGAHDGLRAVVEDEVAVRLQHQVEAGGDVEVLSSALQGVEVGAHWQDVESQGA